MEDGLCGGLVPEPLGAGLLEGLSWQPRLEAIGGTSKPDRRGVVALAAGGSSWDGNSGIPWSSSRAPRAASAGPQRSASPGEAPEEIPPDVFRRVIETNLFGYVHGARAALPYLREQGSGVIINNASVLAAIGQPYTSASVMTKWAIRGLGECLRQELVLDGAPNIHVCTVLPASVDTPLFQQGANYTGRAVKPMNPVLPAETVARAIIDLAEQPRREQFVGLAGHLLAMQHTLAPGPTERLFAAVVDRAHFQDRPAEPTQGNLFQPMPQWASVSGGWQTGLRLPVAGVTVPALAAIAGTALWLGLRLARREPRRGAGDGR